MDALLEMNKLREMDNPLKVKFGHCPVVIRDKRVYFVWTISDATKAKICKLLGVQDIEFGFNSTLEQVPPFFCHECGVEITFFDQVRTALSKGSHPPERLIQMLQQKVIFGTGAVHHICCEHGHEQVPVMGWPMTFMWTFEYRSDPLPHRQTELGAVERLDAALLVDPQNDSTGGRST
jgi:hypothetical protein